MRTFLVLICSLALAWVTLGEEQEKKKEDKPGRRDGRPPAVGQPTTVRQPAKPGIAPAGKPPAVGQPTTVHQPGKPIIAPAGKPPPVGQATTVHQPGKPRIAPAGKPPPVGQPTTVHQGIAPAGKPPPVGQATTVHQPHFAAPAGRPPAVGQPTTVHQPAKQGIARDGKPPAVGQATTVYQPPKPGIAPTGKPPAVGQATTVRKPTIGSRPAEVGKAAGGGKATAAGKPFKPQTFNLPNNPNPEAAPAVEFQQNRRIEGSQNWQGSNYTVFRDYSSEWHDRNWWGSHYNRVVFISGGWYARNAGFWYPAWGYDAGSSYYPYDGPIYGYNDLPPDQVIANVQAALQEQGYYHGEVDGLLGPLTRAALADYQRDHGLYETSAIDQPTLESLGMT